MSSDYSCRLSFDHDAQILEVDFSDITFENSKMVDDFYDEIDRQVAANGPKWYLLVNYRNCRIFELAWIRFAQRGKRLNLAHSLGSVRFAMADAVADSHVARSKSENFDPNVFGSRDDAIAEIERMKVN